MQFLRGFIHLRVEQCTHKIVTPKHVSQGKKDFSFKIKHTPWIMNKYLCFLVFDAVDIFQSNTGTLPQLQMFPEY